MDIGIISARNVSFGGRFGHEKCLRAAAINSLGLKKVAIMTDTDIQIKYIEDGFLPVKISEYMYKDETIFLIKRGVLEKAVQLSR